jgi:protocatechuate 3,4-dioxygenase beta subunit
MRWISLTLVLLFAALAHAATGTVTVVDADNHPLAGVQVHGYLFETNSDLLRTTDARGRVTIDGPTARNDATMLGRLTIYQPGFAVTGAVLHPGENTVLLARGHAVRGSVRDAGGAPVAGARVRLSSARSEDAHIFLPKPFYAAFTVATDDKGAWAIPDLPADGRCTVQLCDPRFMAVIVTFPLSSGDPPALVALPGAVIAGAVRNTDGAPAAGLTVEAFAINPSHKISDRAEAVTGADGSYQLSGLASGLYQVFVEAPEDRTAIARQATAVEGKTVTGVDFALIPGALITGKVCVEETGAPIPNVNIGCTGLHRPGEPGHGIATFTQSDAAGAFRFRVPPGECTLYFPSWMDGFVHPENLGATKVTVPAAGAAVTLRLKRGLTLKGVVLDEVGKPAAGVPVEVNVLCGQCGEEGCWHDLVADGVSGPDGAFAVSGLKPGKARVFTYRYQEQSEWDLIGKVLVTLPADAPATLHVRRPAFVNLTGRVVTADGVPLPGAQVEFTVEIDMGNQRGMSRYQQCVSGADGAFQVEHLRANNKVTFRSVKKAGFQFRAGGAVLVQAAGLKAADIVMTALNGSLTGTVTDAAGAPAAGAMVAVLDVETPRTVTADAAGCFTLDALPAGERQLCAVKGAAAVYAKADTGAPAALTLVDPPATTPAQRRERGIALLQKLWRDSASSRVYQRTEIARYLAAIDLSLALGLVGKDGSLPEDAAYQLIYHAARHAPERVAEVLPLLGQIHTPREKRETTLELAYALVKTDRARAETLYQQAKAIAVTLPPDQESWLATIYDMEAYRIARALGKEQEAVELFARIRKVTLEHATEEGDIGGGVVEFLAEFDMAGAREIAFALPEAARGRALGTVVRTELRTDPVQAKADLAELQRISGTDNAFDHLRALVRYIDATGAKDPAGALALARAVKDRATAGEALAAAALHQPPAQAVPLLQEAFALIPNNSVYPLTVRGHIAALVAARDPQAGRELFTRARAGYEQQRERDAGDLAGFVRYYAAQNPADARLLLETAFVHARRRPDSGWEQAHYATALATLDPDRALQLAYSLPDYGESLGAQAAIAKTLTDTNVMPQDRWRETEEE